MTAAYNASMTTETKLTKKKQQTDPSFGEHWRGGGGEGEGEGRGGGRGGRERGGGRGGREREALSGI